jgi:hypothetical protein
MDEAAVESEIESFFRSSRLILFMIQIRMLQKHDSLAATFPVPHVANMLPGLISTLPLLSRKKMHRIRA